MIKPRLQKRLEFQTKGLEAEIVDLLTLYQAMGLKNEGPWTQLIVVMLALMSRYPGALDENQRALVEAHSVYLGSFEKQLSRWTSPDLRFFGNEIVSQQLALTHQSQEQGEENIAYAKEWKHFKQWWDTGAVLESNPRPPANPRNNKPTREQEGFCCVAS
jgi:hypothetical protein